MKVKRIGGLVTVALLVAACSSVDVLGPSGDALPSSENADAASVVTATPLKPPGPPDDASRPPDDASRPWDDAGDRDGARDGDMPTDASLDGQGDDAASADSGAEQDASDGGGGAPRLFAAGENNVAYDMHVDCTVTPATRVGTASSCCRQSSYTTATVCETVLTEEPDGLGNLVVRVGPMQGCVTTTSANACTRSGTLARCDMAGLLCPYTGNVVLGPPSLVEGTYARRLVGTAASSTAKNEYWLGCSTTTMVPLTAPSCATNPVAVQTTSVLQTTTFAKAGPGVFAIRRSWLQSPPTGFCSTPSSPPANAAIGNTTFVSGGASMGGSFSIAAYGCTYTLAKK